MTPIAAYEITFVKGLKLVIPFQRAAIWCTDNATFQDKFYAIGAMVNYNGRFSMV